LSRAGAGRKGGTPVLEAKRREPASEGEGLLKESQPRRRGKRKRLRKGDGGNAVGKKEDVATG